MVNAWRLYKSSSPGCPPGGGARTGASETILLFPPGELYSPRVVLPRKLELFRASVLSSVPFLSCIFSVTF
ncbi:hypothetical protein VN97_g3406 [Penicillium thymicola]|uniref:Uncharacterized protein n=1 Tax=Penicillium thymicola TaxID=293382 RepID=A0AAI9TN24_PENTH|nr:hypothetical protein VN97_g3406 [Penicillium thymicola]